jgi:hypothetical protein
MATAQQATNKLENTVANAIGKLVIFENKITAKQIAAREEMLRAFLEHTQELCKIAKNYPECMALFHGYPPLPQVRQFQDGNYLWTVTVKRELIAKATPLESDH